MAWPPNSAMGGGGMGVGDVANGGHAPLGTEYTLQGVMRFLQTEWHRHERDRNAWDIERAEMKTRIARLEGDARTAKRLHESLGKHVKILEIALTKEREKVKALNKGEPIDIKRDSREVAREELKTFGKDISIKGVRLPDSEGFDEDPIYHGLRKEAEREKSRNYLAKCAAEITYHVLPANHPPPELTDQDLSNHVFPNQHLPHRGVPAESYSYHAQGPPHQKQQLPNNVIAVRENSIISQQPLMPPFNEPAALSRPTLQTSHGSLPPKEPQERRAQDGAPAPLTAIDRRKPMFDQQGMVEERMQTDVHGQDIYGKREISQDSTHATPRRADGPGEFSEGWNFDENPTQNENQQTEVQLSHRPDTDAFPNANLTTSMSPPRLGSHRRKSSGAARRRLEAGNETRELAATQKSDSATFKVRFALRGHLDVVRSVIFTGGGSPSEPELCTAGDDGSIKRWIIPASYPTLNSTTAAGSDLDITSNFTHRGHSGAVTALAACSASPNFSNGGRALGDGWIFSGGQDCSVKVWERGRVDPKATLDGHTDAVWALCVLPGSCGSTLGDRSSSFGGSERVLLASGGADGSILIWAVSTPPQLSSPHSGSNRGARSSRRANSVSAGSNFPSSPQPNTATSTPFHHSLVHHIVRADSPSPTCISPLSALGENFVVSFTDASILVFDTRTGEELVGMASLETYDGTPSTGVNSVVASTIGFDGTLNLDHGRGLNEEDSVVHGATGSRGGVEGVIISGYEDRYIRFFDANSGQCTYTMLAHPSAISSLSLSPDGRELVSAGHDASLRFWSLEKRSCTQEITSHRLMRGEGICSVTWSQDGRWVISAGGDGVVKVFTR